MFTDSTLDWALSILLVSALISYFAIRWMQWRKWMEVAPLFSGKESRIQLAHPWVLGIRSYLYLCIASLVIVTLFFPIEEENPDSEPMQGVDILFLVDTSLSMNAVDASPNRLTRFKELLLPMIPNLLGNRLGIVAFAGSPFLYCPLTSDLNAFSDYLRGLDVDVVGDKGSILSSAFKKARELLESDKIMRNRILVLVSDGEDHSDAEVPDFSAKLVVWGLGDGLGSPIFYNDSETGTRGYVTKQGTIVPNASSGELVLSVSNQDFLRDIARSNRGEYYNLTNDGSSAWKLLDTVEKMEKNSLSYWKSESRYSKAHITLIPLVLLFFLDVFLVEFFLFFRGRIFQFNSIFALVILTYLGSGDLYSQSWFNPGGSIVSKGVESYRQENFSGSRKNFEQAEEYFPDDPRLSYNKGSVLLKEGKPHEALPLLEKGARSSDSKLQAESYFNLGKAYSALGQNKQALESYRKALELRNDFPEARKNMELLFRSPPPKQPSPDQNQGNNSDSPNPNDSKNQSKDQNSLSPDQSSDEKEPSRNTERDSSGLSREEADRIMDSLNPDQIKRKKGKSFFQPQRDKFW